MDWKLFAVVFGTVFAAELGDKTQLATLLYASRAEGARWTVFAGAATALVLSAAVGVLAGGLVAQYVNPLWLGRIAGLAFVAVGSWILLHAS